MSDFLDISKEGPTFGPGLFPIFTKKELLALAIAVPGHAVIVQFDNVTSSNAALSKFFGLRFLPKHGFHLEKLAVYLRVMCQYRLENFREVNDISNSSMNMYHDSTTTLYSTLSNVPQYNAKDLLEDHQWQALREFGQIDTRHIKASACLAEMAHYIGRYTHKENVSFGWSYFESNFPDLVELWCKLCIESNTITRSSNEGHEVDYDTYLTLPVHHPLKATDIRNRG